MALFMNSQAKEPLVERQTKEAIAKRGAETIGILLVVLAGLLAIMAISYSPNDPGLFNATDMPAQNMLGLPGAYTSDLIHRAIGWAGWSLPLLAGVWGLRFILHKGEGRVLSRIILAPFAVALASIFAAAHPPLAGWAHDYGLGGWFGDAVLGGILTALPLSMNISLVTVTLILLASTVVVSAISLGVTFGELRWAAALAAHSARATIRSAGKALGFAGASAATAAIAAKAAHSKRREASDKVGPEIYRNRLLRGFSRDTDHRKTDFSDRAHLPEVTGNEPDQDKAIMARITAAVAARERAELNGNRDMDESDVAPDLGGVTRDLPIAEALMDLPEYREETPEPFTKVHTEPAKPRRKSVKARAEEQPRLFDDSKEGFILPPLALLEDPSTITRHVPSSDALNENARMLETVLDDYGVKGEIVSVRPGPVVTMYELEPAAGLKASRVIGLSDDIARSMSALAARVSTVPGRSVIGIELPNDKREMVLLREILSDAAYGDAGMKLPLALGKDISGEPIVANLAKMPHLLIAGTTGSGKSVAINTMILSLLYQLSPDECRMIMIDPKMLELSVYDGIPHLLSPVVTDPKKAVVALKWVVAEMEERYRKMSKMGVRNIDGYNSRVKAALAKGEDFNRTIQTGFDEDTGEPIFETEYFTPETMPYIVVIVDEMADLMMVAGKEIEACIQRLAQMARASGIHLIMATQRPSVDVITGTIKANFPTRISFQVTSKIDSRTILGEQGAEQLLGMGDMLYMAGGGRVTRVHGPFVSDEAVEEVVAHLKSLGVPEYVSGVVDGPDDEKASDIDAVLGLGGNTTGEDALYDQAVAIVAQDRKCSTSYIQRKLSIGYNKAAKLVEQMEDEGVVSQANHVGKREVLVPERRQGAY